MSSPLALLAKVAAMKQPLPPQKRKTFHFTSPTPTPLLPSKKQKTTTSPNNTPMPDSSPQTTSSTSLKRKHEECIKDMVQLSDKWTLLNNRFKNTSVARMFRKKDSNTTLYLYHFHRQLYNMVTKEILLAIAKERNLQKRTILPFGTLSPHYQTLKDQTFLEGLRTLLKSRKRTMRSKLPLPVFTPSPGSLGGIGGPTITIPKPLPSAPVTAPLPHIGPIPVIRQFIHPSSSLPKEIIPLPPVVPRVPTPPLVDPSPFVPVPTYSSPPLAELPQVASPPLPLVPWGSHRREYSSMEQYDPPIPMDETPDPVNVPLPPSLPISTPVTQQTKSILLPPAKWTTPSSLNLIPLPWDMPPFPRIIDQLSPPVASSSQLPLIVSMTPSRTTPLLPKHPLTEDEPPVNRPMRSEWKRVQSLPVTGKQKELSPESEPSPPVASSS